MFTSANGDRSNVRNVFVIVTDGQSNNMERTLAEARRLRNEKNVEILVVAVKTDGFNYQELWGMASDPNNKNLIRIVDFERVTEPTNINQLSDYVCNSKFLPIYYLFPILVQEKISKFENSDLINEEIGRFSFTVEHTFDAFPKYRELRSFPIIDSDGSRC